jgi:Cysteine-rich CPCC
MYLTEEQTLALQLRRRSFQLALADQRVQGALIAYSNAERPLFAVCPCCGYPTIAARNWHDTCPICLLEDDGQDDPDADEVRGGPNYRYSLSEARRNFIYARTKFSRGSRR